MSYINKQKFLAELGRLLTFMYEEDRQTALSMYTKMFDDAEDEQALLQYLVSPTRQAVVLARSYDAKERKLQVHSQSRDADADDYAGVIPDFVRAIDDLQQDALTLGVVAAPVDVNQISLFGDLDSDSAANTVYAAAPQTERVPDAPVYAEQSYRAQSAPKAPVYQSSVPQAPAYQPSVPQAPAYQPSVPQAPAYQPSVPQAPAYQPSVPQAPAYQPSVPQAPEYQPSAPQAPVQEQSAPDAKAKPAKAPAAAKRGIPDLQHSNDLEQFADAVDAFLADFSIDNQELIPDEEAEPESQPQQPALESAQAVSKAAAPAAKAEPFVPAACSIRVSAPPKKAKTGLLILYIILAIPLTLLGIAVLLIPTLLFLALAVGIVSLGVLVFSSAFSGFAVLADILVVLGAALAILAVGLLCSWLFVWFIGGAITGLIRGVCHLGREWCYKEVAA